MPTSVAIDGEGNFYVAEVENSVCGFSARNADQLPTLLPAGEAGTNLGFGQFSNDFIESLTCSGLKSIVQSNGKTRTILGSRIIRKNPESQNRVKALLIRLR